MTFSNLMKMAESFPKGEKTLYEKAKLLVTSNFSFSHRIFKRLALQTCKDQGLFGKGLSVYIMYRHLQYTGVIEFRQCKRFGP